jgi:hypothetical protein
MAKCLKCKSDATVEFSVVADGKYFSCCAGRYLCENCSDVDIFVDFGRREYELEPKDGWRRFSSAPYGAEPLTEEDLFKDQTEVWIQIVSQLLRLLCGYHDGGCHD